MKIKLLTTTALALLLFVGCSVKKSDELSNSITEAMKKEKAYIQTTQKKHAGYREEAYLVGQKNIDVGFYKKPLSEAMREVSQMLDIGFDESFLPSTKYKISIEYRGTLTKFLQQVRAATGVSYKYRNNSLKITNKQLIEEDKSEMACKVGQKPTVTVALNNVEPMEIFKYFSKKYGFNFKFQTKYYSIGAGESGNKTPLGNTSLFYSGCDAKEALHTFLSSIDFVGYEDGKNRFRVQDYKLENIDVPLYFDYKYTSGQTLGDSASSSSGSTVSIEENTKTEFLEYLTSFMNPEGIIKISNRGYITIIDKPLKVDEIKQIVQTEIEKQTPIELSVSIVRISLSDELNTGTNFNLSLNSILGEIAPGVPSYIGTGDYTSDMSQGLSLEGTTHGLPIVFKALKQLGDTKIVREYNVKTRNGILSTFRAVDKIPYITTGTVSSSSTTETSTEAKFATSGIIINILPQLSENQETINMSTDILISEYLGDKTFDTAQGELKLPQITENETQVPVSIKMGETVVLTGFNLKEDSSTRSGVPTGIEQNLFYTERLFGSIKDDNRATQLVVIVTPKKIEDF